MKFFSVIKISGLLVLNLVLLSCATAQKTPSAEAKSPYKIQAQVMGLQDTVAYLANYFGDKLYYNDTAKVDSKGFFEFEGKPFNECGKYALVIPGPKMIEFIVAEEDIFLKSDTNDFQKNIEVVKSKENKMFFDYGKYISSKKLERDPIVAKINEPGTSEKEKESLKEDLKKLNQSVLDYQDDLFEKNGDMLVSKMIKMTLDVKVPDAPEGVEDAKSWRYYYYRDHFWDNVDLEDPRLVRDQYFQKLFSKYWEELVPQHPDSLQALAPDFCRLFKNEDMFKYVTHNVTYGAEKSNIMCMDKVFVTMVDEFYKTGQAEWLNEEQLSKVIEAADKKRNTMCGSKVPNVILPDTTLTNWVNLYNIESKYTVIVIWESTCGHCKKEMPKLKDLYEKYKPLGLEVFAIGNDFETEPWIKFVKENDLDWINVSDNPQINAQDSASFLIRMGITTLPSLNFRTTFDVFSTPKVFLLDEDKKVLAKQLNAEQIDEMIRNLEGIVEEEDDSEKDTDDMDKSENKATEEKNNSKVKTANKQTRSRGK